MSEKPQPDQEREHRWYQFSLLSLFLILTAFAVGWWLGARSEDRRSAEREAKIETVVSALNAATFINAAFNTTDIASEERRNQRRNGLLITELWFLARAEPYGSENQEDTFLMNADHALDLLGVESQDGLKRAVEKASLIDSAKAPFLDPNNDEYDDTTDFIRRAFDRRKSQPSFPARVWLNAIVNDDSSLLKTAYSDEVASKTEDWQSRLEEYRQQLEKDLGEFDRHQFDFGSLTSWDQEGEIDVSYKGKEYRTFKIIREQTGWRLDEF